MPTIKILLAQATKDLAATSDSPALDAEVLLCHVLDKPRSYLRAWCDQTISDEQQRQFQRLWQQRCQGQPIAYLTGQREFWSRDFFITPDVLIPRPATELLIELSLQLIPAHAAWNIIDLGTGSGIIAITLAAERPNVQLTAVDLSQKALQAARQNASRHQTNNVQFLHSNWFNAVPLQRFQLVISNPPYIAENDGHLQQGDLRFEPESALIASGQGLDDIKTIAKTAKNWLTEDGHLLIEHGYDQEAVVQAIFTSCAYREVQTYCDLSGQPRATYGRM
ncbi:MAG: peptide chain release factor N(5)-glutamine methyltransferase [Methylovulum sp.]|uniref:peptide chain release factor N(5)-glutamine methyltransferase n=1 Tax=Methylovulum sp. TaxID=1916980 RepID=UPI00260E4296|nr:peptide chain release factor N(5)-glutamine methyltransferase [Methylovulum sp.]MDD2724444.1 peptide chain release factor N(5)-glutamine methyltransferase [Methylovulum sp.]MDD5123677.1 peptide chain release factor N(5)-glutamine methyltransferase [Methylovulum sp.]